MDSGCWTADLPKPYRAGHPQALSFAACSLQNSLQHGPLPEIADPAALDDLSRSVLMIAAEMKIQPGGCLVQLPHPRRDASLNHLIGLIAARPALIGPEPYAGPIRVHLALPVTATAAGAVADMLGALGLRAQIGHMLDAAVAALAAIEQQLLGRVFDKSRQQAAADLAVQEPGEFAIHRC